MGDDNINIHLYHGGKFVKGRRLKYEGDSCRSTGPDDVDKLSYFEMKGIALEEIGYDAFFRFVLCDTCLIS